MSNREKTILDTLIDTRLCLLNKIQDDSTIPNQHIRNRTRIANHITKKWQEKIREKLDLVEEEVISGKNEKIDLVDFKKHTAYELKVSGKNCHHEFYKDLIKVITYNLNKEENEKIKKLIFISEDFGIVKLNNRLDKNLREEMKCKHDIIIELIAIETTFKNQCDTFWRC